ncbi:hypothetical protein CIG75_16725 [Tumebacillus algifaecis]|uniref:Uncharacterized protein n=1 Tax=Tumebacillus algifaecis TaxID=1214604 RepID=A0A223D493_9BACL|nr:hypothetical protein [Tumebacillus algifaecis]ASS76439.1 hypothetical protein CIG75_16725 [Tumebacillus algifaecis]
MAHFLRVMTKQQTAPALAELTEVLKRAGFEFETFPDHEEERFADPNWQTLHIAYDANKMSLILDRSKAGDETGELAEEIAEFQENLQALEGQGKAEVAAILSSTEQIFACLIPNDITERGWEVAEKLLEQLLDATDGHLQVDGEGFYDKEGELLFEME